MFALACIVVLIPGFAYMLTMDTKAILPIVKEKNKDTGFIIVFW